jgi:hypothetical protein
MTNIWGIRHILDWIARAYHWFYHEFLQRPESEPITRQASRMVQRWPAFCWGVELVVLGLTAALLRGWWIILTVCVFLFTWWWNYHILEYSVVHKEDNPLNPKGITITIEKWASGRRDKWLERKKSGRSKRSL